MNDDTSVLEETAALSDSRRNGLDGRAGRGVRAVASRVGAAAVAS
ncbi:hypothetical protein [Rhodococcus sp. NPDC003348]